MNAYQFGDNAQGLTDPLGLSAVAVVSAGFGADAMTPEPSDVLPWKWAGWGVAFAGAALYDVLSSDKAKTDSVGKCNKPKCPDDIYRQLTEKVEKAKAYSSSLKKCLDSMSNDELQLRINAANMELDARMERENRCWDGGDAGHKEQMDGIQNRIKRCRRYMK